MLGCMQNMLVCPKQLLTPLSLALTPSNALTAALIDAEQDEIHSLKESLSHLLSLVAEPETRLGLLHHNYL